MPLPLVAVEGRPHKAWTHPDEVNTALLALPYFRGASIRSRTGAAGAAFSSPSGRPAPLFAGEQTVEEDIRDLRTEVGEWWPGRSAARDPADDAGHDLGCRDEIDVAQRPVTLPTSQQGLQLRHVQRFLLPDNLVERFRQPFLDPRHLVEVDGALIRSFPDRLEMRLNQLRDSFIGGHVGRKRTNGLKRDRCTFDVYRVKKLGLALEVVIHSGFVPLSSGGNLVHRGAGVTLGLEQAGRFVQDSRSAIARGTRHRSSLPSRHVWGSRLALRSYLRRPTRSRAAVSPES